MATLLGLKNKSLAGSVSVSGDSLSGIRTRFSDTYIVRAANSAETQKEIQSVSGIPALRSFFNGAYLQSKVVREVDSAALLWEVDCHYNSKIEKSTSFLTWDWSAETVEEVLERDSITGAPIVNKSFEPLVITCPFPIPVLTITRVEPVLLPATILRYMSTVNSTGFLGFIPGVVMCSEISDTSEIVDGQDFRRVTYVFKFNLIWDEDIKQYRGWRSRPLNHGSKYFGIAGDAASLRPFTTGDNDTLTTGNLALDGTALANDANPIHLLFNRLRPSNFNALNLNPF